MLQIANPLEAPEISRGVHIAPSHLRRHQRRYSQVRDTRALQTDVAHVPSPIAFAPGESRRDRKPHDSLINDSGVPANGGNACGT